MEVGTIALKIHLGVKLVGSKTFRGHRIFIGRHRRAQVRIAHSSVADLHAVIEKRSAGYMIGDLESENGILKNGQPVRESNLLTGDLIQIGRYTIQVEIDTGMPAVPLPPIPVIPPEEWSLAPKLASRKLETVTNYQLAPGQAFAAVGAAKLKSRDLPPPPVERIRPPPIYRPAQAAKSSEPIYRPSPAVPPPPPAPESRGTLVEVSVKWGDRVIQVRHVGFLDFARIGPRESDDIVVPFVQSSRPFLQVVPSGCQIYLPYGATLEIANRQGRHSFDEARTLGKVIRRPAGFVLKVAQGDVVTMMFNNTYSIVVRYLQPPPRNNVKRWRPFAMEQAVSWLGIFLLVSTFALWNGRFNSGSNDPTPPMIAAQGQVVFQKKIKVIPDDPSLDVAAVADPEPVAKPAVRRASTPSRTRTLLKRNRVAVISTASASSLLQPGSLSQLLEKVEGEARELASLSGQGADPAGITDQATASIDHEGVRLAIEKILGRIKTCYDDALVRRPALEGEIKVRFLIGPGGIVQSAETRETTLSHAAVERCVESEIKQQKFPLPVAGTVAEIDYPFIFKRDNQK